MAKNKDQDKDDLQQNASADAPQQETTAEEGQEQTADDSQQESLTTLEKMKRQASEGDEAPTASLRFKDILGGDYLWALVRNQIWLIMLVVLITTAYIAVRYQCQQDAIDISQLEKSLVDAKFQALSSSSNLTRMCRQSNVVEMLKDNGDSLLHISQQPPYIIEVPEN
ncbi:MAG: hypothetical protein K5683_10090 [Prevotella sp.]|nr:hypothetical protein [Prevotella sp.]